MEINKRNPLYFQYKGALKFIMRTILLLFCATTFALTPKEGISQKIKISEDKLASVDEVFRIIKSQTKNYMFIYKADLFKDLPDVELKKGSIRMDKLINLSLSGGNLSVVVTQNNTILIKKKMKDLQIQVAGRVTDQEGLPIINATVLVKGTTMGAATDFDGRYLIMVPNPEHILMFSALGFVSKEISVGTRTTIDVQLEQDVTQLGEVVLNAGYYTVNERDRTGNISKVTVVDIEKQPVSNPLAALQGRMPGVNISQFSGLPGAQFTIEIRGRNSIAAGNDPLYIVDGVPFATEPINYSQTSGVLAGTISPLNGINPADIESVEVLKDADATAIYGSRGANGVVLITTKKGKSGKAKLNIHMSSSLGRVTHFMELMNTQQYLKMRKEAFANDGITSYPANAYDVNGTWNQNRYTDWQKEFIGGTAYRTMVQASISGGSNSTRYLMSGTYQKENTVFPGENGYKKGSVLLNLGHNSDDDKLNLSFSGNLVMDHNDLPDNDFTRVSRTLPPNAPALYGEDGELNWENNSWTNPLANMVSRFIAVTHTLTANSVISYLVMKGLTTKINLGYTESHVDDNRIIPSTRYNPSFGADSRASSIYKGSATRTSWIVEPQLNWQTNMGQLGLNVLVGSSFQNQRQERLGLYGYGFSSNELIGDISGANSTRVNHDTDSQYKYQAFFGRVNLNYEKKYILNLTGRRDGSSRFGPGRQFANFGAIGAAWLFSEEGIMKKALPVLRYGKLRMSYGTTGNDQIGDYQFFESYSLGSTNYDGKGTLLPSRLFNPNFGWERNEKFEVGLELGFWNKRLMLAGSFYKNRSSNQLVGVPMPGTTGFNTLQANLGAVVENKGLELEISSRLVESRKLNWKIAFNLSLPKNELVSFPGLEASTYANRFVVGEPLGISKLFYTTGVDSNTGIYQFHDYDLDGSISVPNDQQWIVDRDPIFYGGLSNHLTLGSFKLDFLLQFSKKNNWNYFFNGPLPGLMVNQPTIVLERWQIEGDDGPRQRFTAGTDFEAFLAFNRFANSSKTISDASYIRLKAISLEYNIPTAITKGIDCKIYLQGQNLLTITKYRSGDPESMSIGWLPPLRQITLGTQITF